MSHDRTLDEIMEIDITPQGPSIDPREARFRQQFLGEGEEMFRLETIEEGAVQFRHDEGDRIYVQGVPAIIKECRGYKQGHTVVPHYLVEAEDGRQAEVDEGQIGMDEAVAKIYSVTVSCQIQYDWRGTRPPTTLGIGGVLEDLNKALNTHGTGDFNVQIFPRTGKMVTFEEIE